MLIRRRSSCCLYESANVRRTANTRRGRSAAVAEPLGGRLANGAKLRDRSTHTPNSCESAQHIEAAREGVAALQPCTDGRGWALPGRFCTLFSLPCLLFVCIVEGEDSRLIASTVGSSRAFGRCSLMDNDGCRPATRR